jgi:membrane-bound lytic murein transglycosylase B
VLVGDEIQRDVERHLGHPTALASAYNLLHRHGWRKPTPDKRHAQADVQAQEEWKKSSRNALNTSKPFSTMEHFHNEKGTKNNTA